MAQVRYIVKDVTEAIAFYVSHLGFKLVRQFGPAMAILQLEDLQLWIADPITSASKPLADGSRPASGNWSRFVIAVNDLDEMVAELGRRGVRFRGEVVARPGGRQILCEDPSGNPIELFQAAVAE